MTKLFEQAIEAVRRLSDEEQDELARMILEIVQGDDEVYVLSDEENAAIDEGLAAIERGDYATMDDLKTLLGKYQRG